MAQDSAPGSRSAPLYVVEHMEEGLEEWCRLEYQHICQVVPPQQVVFLNFPEALDAPGLAPPGGPPPQFSPDGLETACPRDCAQEREGGPALPEWARVCLLDMDAPEALEPEDAERFGAFVFGGILGNVITNEDGSYGSDDRTAEVRRLGFAHRRHLGPMQMTTDTAVLVTHLVLEESRRLHEIPFVDSPEIGGDSDCIVMEGFRYVARDGAGGKQEPTLPPGMAELLMRSGDDDILGSL